jgi:hypothetical protein
LEFEHRLSCCLLLLPEPIYARGMSSPIDQAARPIGRYARLMVLPAWPMASPRPVAYLRSAGMCKRQRQEMAMKRQTTLRRVKTLGALVSTTSLVVACGGGGGGGSDTPDPSPSSFTVTGKAVDGPLQGATACYDLNGNLECDSGEPRSAATGADGSFTISGIAPADIGQRAVVVDVPGSAIDADTGTAVGQDFAMVSPATGSPGDHTVFVSPLSTAVVLQMLHARQARDDAAAFLQSQLGLTVSPLADFSANTKAAHAARLTRSTMSQQSGALAGAVGQTDLSGATVTQDDVDEHAARSVLAALPMIGGAATDASLQGKTGTALRDAISVLAADVVQQAGPTVTEAVAAIGAAKLTPDAVASGAPAASGSLSALRYNGPGDWYLRSFQASAADNTPDANGLLRYTDVRMRVDATNPGGISWSYGSDYNRAGDRLWNGGVWRTCDLGFRNTTTARDASGRSSYNFCDGYEKGTSLRHGSVDIAGQSMATVLTERIRVLPGGSGGVNFADWGPSDLSLLGTATFPAGSRLTYQTSTALETTMGYDARDSNVLTVSPQAVADGGDGRTGTPACASASTPAPAASLEQLVARFPGKPCVFNAATNADGTSLNPNEAWGSTSVSMGDVVNYFSTLPAGTGNYYNNTGRMRVTFTGNGNETVYHVCRVRRIDGSTRNCVAIGGGSYAIATMGDARAMTFSNLPAAFSRTTSTRVFVERNGSVYYGYRSRLGDGTLSARLNMTAANAMLGQLGLPLIAPTGP